MSLRAATEVSLFLARATFGLACEDGAIVPSITDVCPNKIPTIQNSFVIGATGQNFPEFSRINPHKNYCVICHPLE